MSAGEAVTCSKDPLPFVQDHSSLKTKPSNGSRNHPWPSFDRCPGGLGNESCIVGADSKTGASTSPLLPRYRRSCSLVHDFPLRLLLKRKHTISRLAVSHCHLSERQPHIAVAGFCESHRHSVIPGELSCVCAGSIRCCARPGTSITLPDATQGRLINPAALSKHHGQCLHSPAPQRPS